MQLDINGIRHSGRDPQNPGKCTQWYFPKYQIAIVDLGGNFGDD